MSKIKNKVLIIVFSIIAIFMLSGNVKALSLSDLFSGPHEGSVVNISSMSLLNRSDLYCIQAHKTFKGTKSYVVRKYINIEGNIATNTSGKQVDSIQNGVLGYILSRQDGYGSSFNNYSLGQKALYSFSNTWYSNVGNRLGINLAYDLNPGNGGTSLMQEGYSYARSIDSNSATATLEDNTNKSNIQKTPYYNREEDTSYIRVGPFNWSFNGDITGVEVLGDNSREISDVKFSRFRGNNEIFMDYSDIKSGENFYITIKATSGNTKIQSVRASVHYESSSPIYTAELWFLTNADSQNLLFTNTGTSDVPNEDDIEITFDYDLKLTKNLKIVKVDSRNQSVPLANVGFILQNRDMNKYVKMVNGDIRYVDNRSDATEFVTNSNGEIYIRNLVIGTYLAYETKNPNYGYEMPTEGIVIEASATYKKITNKQIYVKLSGYIWKDIQSGKQSVRNNLYKNDTYDVNDQSFNGIIVRLKDKNGTTLSQTTSSERGLYSEINGGEYIFIDVLIDKLNDYYIEFEYDGLIYQSVIPYLNKNNGSKSTDKVERETLDRNFARVDSTGENRVNVNNKYSISYNETKNHATSIKDSSACILHAKTHDAGYNIANYFVPATPEIRFINLGLYEKPQADLALAQDLDYVNVGVNGYWHIYKYATRSNASGVIPDDSQSWNVGVKFKNDYTGSYRRAMYKSDLDYVTSDKNKELQVYLTYKIAIRNESSYLTKANNIVDYFDNRYTLVNAGTGIDTNYNITGALNVSSTQAYNNQYNKCVIDTNTTVKPGESNYVYLQFRLEREAVLQIINSKETLYNVAEINSYTVYKDNNGNTVAAVDKDSVPGNIKPGIIETYEDDTEAAPPVQLEIGANARQIQGSVFEDSTSGELKTGQIRQGDGIYTNGEKGVSGVKVTLHELNNSIPDMVTTTDNEGNFGFSSYIPGQYTVTYTWGDKTYTVQDYKGTVYDSNRNQNDMYWYKDVVDTRKTDAIDSYNTRIEIDKQMRQYTDRTIYDKIVKAYEGNNPDGIITSMDSKTPTIEFSVEYDTTVTDGTIDKVEFIVKNVDFGIVERARQQLDLSKRVKSFKIVLANGQILVDATIKEDGTLSGTHDHVTYMGPSNINGIKDNGFIKAEIDNELIEGATLEVSYEIKTINNSELDYMSEEYYKYGIQKGNVVTLTPPVIIDYLDKNLGFEADKNPDWEQTTVEELKSLNAVKVGDTEFLNSRLILKTEKLNQQLQPTESKSVDLNVSKLLTTSNDLTFSNDAEIAKVTKPSIDPPQHTGSVIEYFPTDEAEEVQITPSTGEDRAYVVPIIVGTVALITLAGGTFVIRKIIMK